MRSVIELDHSIIRNCVENRQFAWDEFVDRFAELVLHTIQHTADVRGIVLPEEEKQELCEAIFRSFRYNNFQLLREFAYNSSASSYLVVLARRLAVAFLTED